MDKEKQFEQVFEKISLSASVKQAFANTQVQKLCIHKKERVIEIMILSDHVIAWKDKNCFIEELKQNLPGIQDVSVGIVYQLTSEEGEIPASYTECLKDEIAQESKICAAVMQDAVFEQQENKLLIYVKKQVLLMEI